MWCDHVLKTWSTTQHCIAMSSGEAELYALTKAAAQVKGLMSVLGDFGREVLGRVCTDATAAIGMAWRRGLGKTRHIDAQYLWLQAELNENRFGITKVDTKSNPADMFTKAVAADTLSLHMEALGFEVCAGRATTAPRLQRVHEPRKPVAEMTTWEADDFCRRHHDWDACNRLG